MCNSNQVKSLMMTQMDDHHHKNDSFAPKQHSSSQDNDHVGTTRAMTSEDEGEDEVKPSSQVMIVTLSNLLASMSNHSKGSFLLTPDHQDPSDDTVSTRTSDSTSSTTTTSMTPMVIVSEKKRVSINGCVHVRPTISRNDISHDEYNAVWYSQDEYAKITESCCKQISKLNRGEILKDKKFCARGLEAHTRTRSIAKRMNRSLACQVVLDEQDHQIQACVFDDTALSRLYHAASSSSQLWARVLGLDDQREANKIYDDA